MTQRLRTDRGCRLVLILGASLLAGLPARIVAGFEDDAQRGISVVPTGDRWAVLVGVDKYKHIRPELHYCSADVCALGELLIKAGFGKERVVIVHDGASDAGLLPTKANIEKQLSLTLDSVGPKDFVFLAFSGHGVRLEQQSYLCPFDGRMDPAELIAVNYVYERLQKCPARFKLFLVDACQDEKSPPKEVVATRAEGDISSLAFGQNDALPPGLLLLTSCSPGQVSVEEPKFGHGVFTHFLLEGLDGKVDADKSGSVSLLEWAGHASSETRAYVRSLDRVQNPSMRGDFTDFELWRTSSITNMIGMQLKLIRDGEFLMGSQDGEAKRDKDEGPQHRVRITRPFYLGVYEVTQAQYEAVMGKNPSNFKGSDLPVENVSWDEAMEFCRRLSAKEGRTYRLPTEAEWEYACRAGTTTPFAFGETLSSDRDANFNGMFTAGSGVKWRYVQKTTPVGSYRANAWGLYDMHGNVHEWCADWYGEDYYATSPQDDPPGPASGSARVRRDCCCDGSPRACRSASRDGGRAVNHPCNRVGFRVALVSAE